MNNINKYNLVDYIGMFTTNKRNPEAGLALYKKRIGIAHSLVSHKNLSPRVATTLALKENDLPLDDYSGYVDFISLLTSSKVTWDELTTALQIELEDIYGYEANPFKTRGLTVACYAIIGIIVMGIIENEGLTLFAGSIIATTAIVGASQYRDFRNKQERIRQARENTDVDINDFIEEKDFNPQSPR